ncbi:MAG TPA: cyclic pyranopterin monophosphate synthase MoaC [Candidatus Latescibacteria bacterium]|nr:cyclic pyranopterin monophosphate synthase MoaC [Candidatus Latescibacterota bacterium]
MDKLTHIDGHGRPKMVSVTEKEDTLRVAVARGRVYAQRSTLTLIKSGGTKKGDVLSTAQIAGIMAAKKTSELIPMCHPLLLTDIEVKFKVTEEENFIDIEAKVASVGKTGVEMEALTAVSVAALTIYDMCKGVDRKITISDIRLIQKTGGKSGDYVREANYD